MQNTGLLRRLAAIIYDTLLVCALLFLATIPFIALRGGEPVEVCLVGRRRGRRIFGIDSSAGARISTEGSGCHLAGKNFQLPRV